jgi:hypothetical protein
LCCVGSSFRLPAFRLSPVHAAAFVRSIHRSRRSSRFTPSIVEAQQGSSRNVRTLGRWSTKTLAARTLRTIQTPAMTCSGASDFVASDRRSACLRSACRRSTRRRWWDHTRRSVQEASHLSHIASCQQERTRYNFGTTERAKILLIFV